MLRIDERDVRSGGLEDDGRGYGRFCAPTGLAVVDSREGPVVLVCDTFNNRIETLRADSARTVSSFGGRGNEPGFFFHPYGVSVAALDPLGRVAVADTGNSRVQVRLFCSHPYGVSIAARDPLGRVAVADTGNSRVQVFSREGEVLLIVGPPEVPLDYPMGVALSSDGEMMVICDTFNHRILRVATSTGRMEVICGTFNHRILRVATSTGRVEMEFGGYEQPFRFPTGVTFGAVEDGQELEFGGCEQPFWFPTGVTFGAVEDGQEVFAVADTFSDRVLIFRQDGELLRMISAVREAYPGGRLSRPHDVSFARASNTYVVADSYQDRASNTYVVADSYQDRVCTFNARGEHLFSFPPGPRPS
ncbi:hypothetical protein T484DRAFT_1838249 [Baffinella frigidus]|nr:hypothetical protein T484DRAFT_1838249 [Cryptophyta sp. CCMP2293]